MAHGVRAAYDTMALAVARLAKKDRAATWLRMERASASWTARLNVCFIHSKMQGLATQRVMAHGVCAFQKRSGREGRGVRAAPTWVTNTTRAGVNAMQDSPASTNGPILHYCTLHHLDKAKSTNAFGAFAVCAFGG